jgi:CheY-like chemotaxis protein
LRAVLELQGDSVWTATEGLQGLAMALDLKPDLVLCDIGIPGIDGFEVARRVRSHPDLAGTRLVALTGYALPEDVAKAREAGFDEHLAKPVDPDALRRL